jgi:hypothetical protein
MAKHRFGVGSVVEIATATGFTYAVCVHDDPMYGLLWRIIDRTFAARPKDLRALIREPERFFAFSPIESVAGDGPFRYLDRVAVPPEIAALPTLRWPIHRPGSSEIVRWKLWSGSTSGALPVAGPEHLDLSILQITHPNALRDRIETGWRPRDRPVVTSPGGPPSTRSGLVRFFIRFTDPSSATAALSSLSALGWTAETHVHDDGVTVVASRFVAGSPTESRDVVERLAREFGGEYEGSEINLAPPADN